MALVTTFATTPLVSYLYPPSYQKKLEAWKRGEIDWDGNRLRPESSDGSSIGKIQDTQVRRLLVNLRLDSLPGLFTFIALLGGDRGTVTTKTHKSRTPIETVSEKDESYFPTKRPLEVHGLRMIELSERTSSVMQSSEIDDVSYNDPVVNAFRTFAQLNNVAVSGSVSVVPQSTYAETLTTQASLHMSDLVMIPWTQYGSKSDLDMAADSYSAALQDSFVRGTLETASCSTAIFYNRGFGGAAGQPKSESRTALKKVSSGLSLRSQREPALPPIADRSHHVYFPFFGGDDDRVALRFVLQLAQNSNITVTITHFTSPRDANSDKAAEVTETVEGQAPSSNSESHNDPQTASDIALLHTLRDSLPADLTTRVVFVEVATTNPLADCLESARQEIAQSPRNAGDLVVVGRSKHALLADVEAATAFTNHEMKKTLGIVAENVISNGIRGSVLVIQAAGGSQKS